MHPDSNPSTIKKSNLLETKSVKEDSEYWLNLAKKFVTKQVKNDRNTRKAKNVIFFLGDGMGLSTLAMTRMYLGGEETKLSFEDFPYTAMSKTYCTNVQVADSACSATAFLSGVKCNFILIY